MDECADGVQQVAMGARTRGTAQRGSQKAVITVRLKSRRGGTRRGRGPPIGDEARLDHKERPLLGEEVEILSRKSWGEPLEGSDKISFAFKKNPSDSDSVELGTGAGRN